MNRYSLLMFVTASLLAALAGCERGAAQIAPPETPIVPVCHPAQRLVTDHVDYTGRINAKDAVTIIPRVTGYLEKMKKPFKEGDIVMENQLLFEIDDRPYQAQLKAAQAAVATNKASLDYAVATNKRFKELFKKQPGAVSERELDQYQALEQQAIASLNLAEANLETAKLNLEWTKVKSPIEGRISRYFLTPGNLVNQDVTQLTTVMSIDPIYVYFDMDEPTLLQIKRAINEGRISPPKQGDAPIEMGLAGEDGFPHKGSINFMDNQVNPNTGSIAVRGVFENPRPAGGTYLFVPGMFVRVHMPIGQPEQRLLVIDRAVTSEQGWKYIFVAKADNTLEKRRVTLGSLQEDGLRVIANGLKKEEWVVIGALQQIRDHMKIQPDQWKEMPTLGTPGTPSTPRGK